MKKELYQEEDLVYDINQLQSSSYNANKNKLKSISQYISIVYANLFQQALSSNELVEIIFVTVPQIMSDIFHHKKKREMLWNNYKIQRKI